MFNVTETAIRERLRRPMVVRKHVGWFRLSRANDFTYVFKRNNRRVFPLSDDNVDADNAPPPRNTLLRVRSVLGRRCAQRLSNPC